MTYLTLGKSAVSFLDFVSDRCQIVGWPNVYAIGTFDREKTVAIQQVRAGVLALALALRYRPGTCRIAVVGAGFSGVALACVLVGQGCQVDQFEKSEHPISVQASCSNTFVHPSLHNWPDEPFHHREFRMGSLSWRAGAVSKVSDEITRQYRVLAHDNREMFRTRFGQRVLSIGRAEAEGRPEGYRIQTDAGDAGRTYDAVIFAIGFGWEPVSTMDGALTRYWEDFRSDLNTAVDAPERVLVSGKGDRALIDILHASLRHYDPTRIFEALPQLADEDLRAKVAEIERKARRRSHGPDLYEQYRRLFDDKGWTDDIRRFGVTANRHVVFNARPPGIFSLTSSALNRVLVYFLIKSGVVTLRPFPMCKEAIQRTNGNGSGKWRITWAQDGSTEEFDRLVLRHGIKADYFWRSFPQLRNSDRRNCADACQTWAGPDIPAEILDVLRGSAPGAELAAGAARR